MRKNGRKTPIRYYGPIVKVLNKMRSRNKSNRLEKHYYVPFEDDVTQWVHEDAIKDFQIVQDFIQSKLYFDLWWLLLLCV